MDAGTMIGIGTFLKEAKESIIRVGYGPFLASETARTD